MTTRKPRRPSAISSPVTSVIPSHHWRHPVDEVRLHHRRKTGFLPGFEAMLQESGPHTVPPFVQRATACWGPRRTEEE